MAVEKKKPLSEAAQNLARRMADNHSKVSKYIASEPVTQGVKQNSTQQQTKQQTKQQTQRSNTAQKYATFNAVNARENLMGVPNLSPIEKLAYATAVNKEKRQNQPVPSYTKEQFNQMVKDYKGDSHTISNTNGTEDLSINSRKQVSLKDGKPVIDYYDANSPRLLEQLGHAFNSAAPSTTSTTGELLSAALPYSGNPNKVDPNSLYETDSLDLKTRYNSRGKALTDPNNPIVRASKDPNAEGSEVYNAMTPEQKNRYNEIYGIHGIAAAEEYKRLILDEINSNIGYEDYENNLKSRSTVEKIGSQFGAGFRSGVQGLVDAPRSLLGLENTRATDPYMYRSQALRADENNSTAENILYDIAQSTGNMAPGMIASYAIGGMGALAETADKANRISKIAQTVGSSVFALSQLGNTYMEDINAGKDGSSASLRSIQMAIDEEATNFFLGGIAAFGGGALKNVLSNTGAAKAFTQAVSKITSNPATLRLILGAADFIADMGSEALQEYTQFFTENLGKNLIYGENNSLNPLDPEAWYSALLGALNAGALNLPGSAINAGVNYNRAINSNVANAAEISPALDLDRSNYASDKDYKKVTKVQEMSDAIADKQSKGQNVSILEKIAYEKALNKIAAANIAEDTSQSVEKTSVAEQEKQNDSVTNERPATNDISPKEFEARVNAAKEATNNVTYGDKSSRAFESILERMENTSGNEETAQNVPNNQLDDKLSSIETRANAFNESVRDTYVSNFKYTNDDVVTYDENMRKVYEAARNGQSLNSLTNDTEFTDFYNRSEANAAAVNAMFDSTLNSMGVNNEEGNNLPGTRSNGALSLGTGEQNGTVSEGTEGVRGVRGVDQKAADVEARSISVGERVRAEEVIPGAKPGQEVYIPTTKSKDMVEGDKFAESHGLKSKAWCGGVLKNIYGGTFRGCTIPGSNEVNAQADNKYATYSQIVKHEVAENKLSRNDFKEIIDKAKLKNQKVIDAAVKIYMTASKDSYDNSYKELICDAHGKINLLLPFEQYAEVNEEFSGYVKLINEAIEIINPIVSEKVEKTKNTSILNNKNVVFSKETKSNYDADEALKVETQSDITDEYQKKVDEILNTAKTEGDPILIGYTPDILTKLGAANLPMFIGKKHIYTCAKTKAEAISQNYSNVDEDNFHGLGEEFVKNIYENMSHPDMIIAAKDVSDEFPIRNKKGVVAIYNVTANNKKVIIPLLISSESFVDGKRIDVSLISTAYKKNVTNLIKDAISTENSGNIGIFYIKKDASSWAPNELQLLTPVSSSASFSDLILHDFSEEVNMTVDDSTKSIQFTEWGGDWQNEPGNASVILDKNNEPKVFYTEKAEKGIKEKWSVVTDRKESINKDYNKVYVKTAAPFDMRKTRAKKVLKDLLPSDVKIVLQSSGLPTLESARIISNYLDSKNYDSIIIDDKEGNASYLIKDGKQIKSMGANVGTYSKDDSRIAFSSSYADDYEKSLFAIHNLNENKLDSLLDLEGIPAPSIAVTKDNIGHVSFGNISFVFGSDTIDPQVDKRNQVYDADAWTPTFPQIDYELDDDVMRDALKKVDVPEIKDNIPEDYHRRVKSFINNTTGGYNSKSYKTIVSDAMQNVDMMAAYLASKGEKVELKEREEVKRMDEGRIEIAEQLGKILGKDNLISYSQSGRELWNAHGEEFDEAIAQAYHNVDSTTSLDEWRDVISGMKGISKLAVIREARNYFMNGAETRNTVTDFAATDKDIRDRIESDKTGYREWIENLFDNIEVGSGVRNNKDMFTPSGNRRSFKQLHDPVTAENIVKAMYSGRDQGAVMFAGMTAKSVRGASAQKYNSIADLHKNEGRLQNVSEGKLFSENEDKLLENANDRLHALKDEVFSHEGLSFGRGSIEAYSWRENAYTEAVLDVATKNLTPKRAVNAFAKQDFDISLEEAQELCDIINELRQLPTDYFEAKPKRVVGWDEVKGAVVPGDIDPALLQKIKDKGIKTITYEPGNKEQMSKYVNEAFADYKFSSSFFDDITDDDLDMFAKSYETYQYAPDIESETDDIKEMNALMDSEIETGKYEGREITDKLISDTVDKIAKQNGSELTEEQRDRVERGVKVLYTYLSESGKKASNTVTELATEIGDDILSSVTETDDTMRQIYPTVEKEIKSYSLKVSESTKKAMARAYDSYVNFHRKYFGRLTLSNEGVEVDTAYNELSTKYPDLFPSEIYNPEDQLIRMAEVLDSMKPGKTNIQYGEEESFVVGQQILKEFFDPENSGDYSKKLDEITKRLERENEARLSELKAEQDKIIQELKDKQAEGISNLKKIYENQIDTLNFKHQKELNSLGNKDEKKIQKLKDSHKEQLARIRSERDKKISKIKSEYRERIGKLNADHNHKIAEIKMNAEWRAAEASAKRLDAADRTRLLKLAKQLRRMKLNPQNSAEFKSLVEGLDLVAKGISDKKVKELKELMASAKAQAEIDPNFKELEYPRIEKIFERLSKKRISEMTGEEVADLTEALLAIRTNQQNFNKTLSKNLNRKISTYGQRIVDQQENVKGINGKNALAAKMGKYRLNMLNPTRAFAAIDGYLPGGVFTELGKSLNDGQTRAKTFEMESRKMFEEVLKDKELVNSFADPTIDIGRGVKISKGMRISLYLHSLNNNNEKHIGYGGIRVPDAKLYAEGKYEQAYRYGKIVQLLPEDLKKIVSEMTPGEKKFAEIAYKFFNEKAPNAINEVSVALNGYEKATVENYFPIKTDPNFIRKEISGLVKDGTIEGMGMLKERDSRAVNPVLLEDVAQVLTRQIDNTSRYYGLAIPVRDFNKIYGYTTKGYGTSVAQAVDKTWGKDGQNYINNVLMDIQNGGRRSEGGIFDILKSKYAGAVLTLNPGVAIKQTASYPFAVSVLDAKSLAKGLTTAFTKADYDYMDSITPWSWSRRQGMSGTEVGEVYKQKSVVEKNSVLKRGKELLNWIQTVDVYTTNRLFAATEFYVQDHFPSLEVRGEEYNKKVAELYNDVIQRTQPSYDVMQRNEYLRDSSGVIKAFTAFKTQTFNMGGEVMDAYGRAEAYRKLAKTGKVSASELKRANKNLAKTVLATLTSQAALVTLGAIAKALMHQMKNYRDKDGEVTKESVAKRMGYEFATSFGGMLMMGSEVQESLLVLLNNLNVIDTGDKMYDITLPAFDSINDFRTALSSWTQALSAYLEEPTQENNKKLMQKSARLGMNGLIVNGISANNIYNIINAVHLWVEDAKKGQLGTFEAGEGLLGLSDTSNSNTVLYDRMFNSLYEDGDQEKFIKTYNKLAEEKGNKAVDTQITTRLKNTSEIKEAAKAYSEGNSDKSKSILESFVKEHKFDGSVEPLVYKAFDSLVEKYSDKEEKKTDYTPKTSESAATYSSEKEQKWVDSGLNPVDYRVYNQKFKEAKEADQDGYFSAKEQYDFATDFARKNPGYDAETVWKANAGQSIKTYNNYTNAGGKWDDFDDYLELKEAESKGNKKKQEIVMDGLQNNSHWSESTREALWDILYKSDYNKMKKKYGY